MSNTYVRRPPVLLSIITILMIIAGILAIVGGIAVIALRNNDDFVREVNESSGTITSIGIGAIISGLISVLLAMALRRGSRIARALVLIYEVLHIICAIFAIIRLDHGTYLSASIVSILLAVIIIWYLYGTRGAREFFGDY
jgi:O-antigen/teichoic acid export membrane protein